MTPTRTYNAADWIAALDRQLPAAPTDAPPIWHAPIETPGQTTAPAARRTNTLAIVLAYGLIHTGLMTALVSVATRSATLALIALVLHLALLLAGIALGQGLLWIKRRRRRP